MMVDIGQFVEACKYEGVGQVSQLLDSRKSFFLFKTFFQARFINTYHDGTTALICAVLQQDLDLVRYLLEKGAEADLPGEAGGTALAYAAMHREPDIVKLLLEYGASVDMPVSNGWTALYLSTVGGNVDTVRVLLEKGATPYVADQQGTTDLKDALEQGNQNVVEAFMLISSARVATSQDNIQTVLDSTVLADLNSNSTKMSENILPDICFVGAPFEGNAPDDIADWVAANRDLMIAEILEIEDPEAFEQLQARIEKQDISTILIPDIADSEILGQNISRGSMFDRSLRVMTQKMFLVPDEFEYSTSVFMTDALNRCSPVSFCFAFRKRQD